MKYLVSAKEMKIYDAYTIERIGIPSLVLMERAALQTVFEIEKRVENFSKVLVIAGTGNNGGDGFAIGRLLLDKGIDVDFYLLGERENCSQETKKQIEILEKYGMKCLSNFLDREYDIIIDALLGGGLSRDLNGKYAKIVENMNKMQAYKVAVDIPSGIHADDGKVMGVAVKVDLTVTYAYAKRGLYLFPGAEYVGEIVCVDIGISSLSFENKKPEIFTYDESEISLLPARQADGNKGTFGKVLVVAGSEGMSGACQLCAKAAYRIGAGMVKVVTHEKNREIIQTSLPEALLQTYTEQMDWKESFYESLRWATTILIGPGTGQNAVIESMLTILLTESNLPLLMDADALNLIAANEELRKLLRQTKDRKIILTPHLGELSRLAKIDIAELKKNPLEIAKNLAKEFHCCVVCKDARTYVVDAVKENIYLNTAGNSGMATAGSGDVLAGIVAGLLAQNMDSFESACVGTYLHAKAGERATKESNEYALIATDIVAQLKNMGV